MKMIYKISISIFLGLVAAFMLSAEPFPYPVSNLVVILLSLIAVFIIFIGEKPMPKSSVKRI